MSSKIVQGLNMLNSQENGLTKSYANSEEFVQALSKYMKISTICSKDELNKCLGYDKIFYYRRGEIKDVELTSLTTASKFHLPNSFLDPAGFVMGDGTPIIVSWNSNCTNGAENATILDPDQPLKAIPTSCFDGVYDINGTRKSNMYGKDVFSIGRARPIPVGTKIDGIGEIFSRNEFSETIDTCSDSTYDNHGTANEFCAVNNWAAAKKYCADVGMKLPDLATLQEIYNKKSEYPTAIPQDGWFWSSIEDDNDSYEAYFAQTVFFSDDYFRTSVDRKDNTIGVGVLCVGN